MNERSTQQTAVLWVVGTACITLLFGVAAMVLLAVRELPIPDQLDRVINLAGVGALALLGRVSDTKQEAADAAEKMVNDLASLVPAAPVEVEVVNTPEAPAQVEVAADPGPPPLSIPPTRSAPTDEASPLVS